MQKNESRVHGKKDYKGLMLLFINLSEFSQKQQREVSLLLVYLAIVLGHSWAV